MNSEDQSLSKSYTEISNKLFPKVILLRDEIKPFFDKRNKVYPKSFSTYDYITEERIESTDWSQELNFQVRWLCKFFASAGKFRRHQFFHKMEPVVNGFLITEYAIKNLESGYKDDWHNGDPDFIYVMLETFITEIEMDFLEPFSEILKDLKEVIAASK